MLEEMDNQVTRDESGEYGEPLETMLLVVRVLILRVRTG